MFEDNQMRERLFKTIRRRVDSDCVAEDLLQEVYLLAFRAGGTLRDEGSLLVWMHVITRNVVNSYWRKHYRDAERDERIKDLLVDPSQQHYPQERRDTSKLHGALMHLPEQQRWLLAMRYSEELTSRQMGAITHMTPSRARVQIHRARNTLRALL